MSIITDKIGVAKSVTVDKTDTPLDARTRCDSEADIPNIKNPYVGMQIYTISDGKFWVVRSLNASETSVLTYEELTFGDNEIEFSADFIVDAKTVSVNTEVIATKEYVDFVFGNSEGWRIPLTFTAEEARSTIKLSQNREGVGNAIQYRLGTSGKWRNYNLNSVITLVNVGDQVQFQNKENTLSIDIENYVYFTMTGKIAASNNIQSMLNYSASCSDYCYRRLFSGCTSLTSAPALPATILAKHCYYEMFRNCTSLTTPPELPATTLAYGCYNTMFEGCTSLTTSPELPATTLADWCYDWMFQNCTSLTTPPELLATTLADHCYSSMFEGCTSLTSAPELPATTLAISCYSGMFDGCTSLTSAPALPATTLADWCYLSMFSDCTSLTKAPALPATTLAYGCYANMFYGCTSLTSTPELPATTLADSCYKGMFSYCTSLNYVKVGLTEWFPEATSDWLISVSPTGTFYKPAVLSAHRGGDYIPVGWEVINI